MERIHYLRQESLQGKLQKDYENMFNKYQMNAKVLNDEMLQMETETLKEKMDDMKREKLDCFKLCFRVKVCDAIYYEKIKQLEEEYINSSSNSSKTPEFKKSKVYLDEIIRMKEEISKNRTIIISFIKSSQELYDTIRDGSRIRFYNVKPDGTVSMQGC